MGQVHGKGRLRRARDADDDDIGLQEAHGVLAVVVFDGEFDSFDAFEIFFVELMDHAGLQSRFRIRQGADTGQHGADDIDDGDVGRLSQFPQFPAQVGEMMV